MPANPSGALAWLVPLAIIFWTGIIVLFSFFDLSALVWWQQALGFLVLCRVWGGLVERCARMRLVRRRLRALPGARTDPAPTEDLENAAVDPPAGARTPWSALAYVVRLAFTVAVGLAIFYPSWLVKLLGFLTLLVAALGFGLWHRQAAAGEPTPVSGPPPLQGARSLPANIE